MTALVAAPGFVPMGIATGAGTPGIAESGVGKVYKLRHPLSCSAATAQRENWRESMGGTECRCPHNRLNSSGLKMETRLTAEPFSSIIRMACCRTCRAFTGMDSGTVLFETPPLP